MALTPRVNYLTNKELLAEIHRSKNTFSYYLDPKYAAYDAIVSSLDDITLELIQQVRESKAKKAMQTQKQILKDQGLKNHQIKIQDIDPLSIPIDEIVWRVMTHEHIPLEEGRVKNPKSVADHHVRLNFPPFKHYILEPNMGHREVGRSHWKNALENGEFSQTHGKITNRLALMFMKLVERYGQRGNWRGYCVDQDTEALTQRGWLGTNDITEQDQIMSYHDGRLVWSSIKSIYRDDHYSGLMFDIKGRSTDMLITPGHKLVTDTGIKKVESLVDSDRLVLMGSAIEAPKVETYSNDLVELIGWIVTEGCYEFGRDGRMRRITIYQNEGRYADRIRANLNNLGYSFSEATRRDKQITFAIHRADSKKFLEILPQKNLNMEILHNLTGDQRELLLDTMVNGDGWRTGPHLRYAQKCPKHVEFFQILCAMTGKRTSTKRKEILSFGKPTNIHIINVLNQRNNTILVRSLDFHGSKRSSGYHQSRDKHLNPNVPTAHYSGKVWCPETQYGCFMARRNGTVYLTGNSYLDEMRSQALLQLSLVGLQFNEARSDNPFAYYTVTVSNAFTRVLNLEKRNQNIRDDMMTMAGVTPSITRQIDNSMAQRALANGEVPEQKKLVRKGSPKAVKKPE